MRDAWLRRAFHIEVISVTIQCRKTVGALALQPFRRGRRGARGRHPGAALGGEVLRHRCVTAASSLRHQPGFVRWRTIRRPHRQALPEWIARESNQRRAQRASRRQLVPGLSARPASPRSYALGVRVLIGCRLCSDMSSAGLHGKTRNRGMGAPGRRVWGFRGGVFVARGVIHPSEFWPLRPRIGSSGAGFSPLRPGI